MNLMVIELSVTWLKKSTKKSIIQSSNNINVALILY
jgi:hypothetical protein